MAIAAAGIGVAAGGVALTGGGATRPIKAGLDVGATDTVAVDSRAPTDTVDADLVVASARPVAEPIAAVVVTARGAVAGRDTTRIVAVADKAAAFAAANTAAEDRGTGANPIVTAGLAFGTTALAARQMLTFTKERRVADFVIVALGAGQFAAAVVVRSATVGAHLSTGLGCAARVFETRVSFRAAHAVALGEGTYTRARFGACFVVTRAGAVADASTRVVVPALGVVTLRCAAHVLVAAFPLGATAIVAGCEDALALERLVARLVIAALGAVECAVALVIGRAALGRKLLTGRRLTWRQANSVPPLDLDAFPVERTLVVTDLGADSLFLVVDAIDAVALVVVFAGIAELAFTYAQTQKARFCLETRGLAFGSIVLAVCGSVFGRINGWICRALVFLDVIVPGDGIFDRGLTLVHRRLKVDRRVGRVDLSTRRRCQDGEAQHKCDESR